VAFKVVAPKSDEDKVVVAPTAKHGNSVAVTPQVEIDLCEYCEDDLSQDAYFISWANKPTGLTGGCIALDSTYYGDFSWDQSDCKDESGFCTDDDCNDFVFFTEQKVSRLGSGTAACVWVQDGPGDPAECGFYYPPYSGFTYADHIADMDFICHHLATTIELSTSDACGAGLIYIGAPRFSWVIGRMAPAAGSEINRWLIYNYAPAPIPSLAISTFYAITETDLCGNLAGSVVANQIAYGNDYADLTLNLVPVGVGGSINVD